jgi:hypothetical protein
VPDFPGTLAELALCSIEHSWKSFGLHPRCGTPCDGFCIYTLAHRGVLTQGNPLLGVMKYKNHHMVFRSEDGVQNFSMNAQYYITQVQRVCLENPALVNLLQLHDSVPKTGAVDDRNDQRSVTGGRGNGDTGPFHRNQY